MKYSSGNSSTLFCEQVSTVTSLFEKWNDCERTVVIYALLKRLRYPSLKFLQHSIETNLNQNPGLQNHMTTFDISANNPLYLQNLASAYKSFPGNEIADVADKESIYFGSDLFLKSDGKAYSKKEDILNDILEMLPLLKPGNDEAKIMYLSLIPIAVEDTVRQIVSTELVQQIFSYLLIHPAISNEDRRSLSHWLRHLEEHIQSSFASAGQQSFYVLSNNTDACLSNSSTSVSSSVGSVASKNAWQAIAPPQSTHKNLQQQQQPQLASSVSSDKTEWNVPMPRISDTFCDNFNGIKINELGSSQNSLGLGYNGSIAGTGGNCPFESSSQIDLVNANNNVDDHHMSFSKNGTEIIDFDSSICDNCSCAQVGFPSLLNNCDQFNRWSLDDDKIGCLKTRRSNSLTAPATSIASSNVLVTAARDNCSESSENLAQYVQKPRSFSLSIEHPRTSLISTGSDTRLDDMKPNYLQFTSPNSGMANIGQWLKSLRLHKYIDLFKNITYETMLGITEEYLQDLGVTKGASHKLALCIEKLNERVNNLTKIEQELIKNQTKLNVAIEELANIVLTPMKPVDSVAENVAFKFMKVLELVSCIIIKKESYSLQDEENVSALLWILERTIHGDAFVAYASQLKELKFKLSKLKVSFAPKAHHPKTGNSVNANKPRWNCKMRKADQKNGSNDRINRKNSNDMLNFSMACSQQTSASRNHLNKGGINGMGNCPEYKSSSYPNFGSGEAPSGHSFKPRMNQQPMVLHNKHFHALTGNQQVNQQQHRRSLNNLIVVSPGQGSSASNSNVCVSSSPMSSKVSLSGIGDGKNRKQSVHRNLHQNDLQQKQTISSGISKKALEKTMAAVVLVSKKTSNEIADHCSIENNNNNNNNNINVGHIRKACDIGVCASSHSCSSILSNNICSAIPSNFIISPASTVLLDNEKHLKNNISDIKSLEQLEFLCLQMTEQAIN